MGGEAETPVAGGGGRRVAFVVGTFPALSETFILAQINGLARAGHAVTVFAEHAGEAAAEVDPRVRVVHARPPSVAVPRRLPGIVRRALGRLARERLIARALREAEVIVANFGWWARAVAGVRRRRGGAALISIFHGSDLSKQIRQRGASQYRHVFLHSERILAVSRHFRDRLIALGAPEARTGVLRMGVDTRALQPVAADAGAARGGGPVRIVTIGRLVEKKGVDDSLRALGRVARAAPDLDWRYEIIGDGPLRDGLAALAEAEGIAARTEFAGPRSHEAALATLRVADIFILTSRTAADGDVEGVPVALMEAMALGLPVISTRHSGIPELVEDGVGGLLADEGDAAAIADAAGRLMRDAGLRGQLGRAGRAAVEREFDQQGEIAALDRMVRIAEGGGRGAPRGAAAPA